MNVDVASIVKKTVLTCMVPHSAITNLLLLLRTLSLSAQQWLSLLQLHQCIVQVCVSLCVSVFSPLIC